MSFDVACQKLYALPGREIDHNHSVFFQPIDGAGKVGRLSYDNRADSELSNQPAAVPARSKRRHHDRVTIAPLSSGFPKRVCLAVDRRIVFLHAAVVPAPQKIPRAIEQRRANRYSTLRETLTRLFNRHSKHRLIIESGVRKLRSHESYPAFTGGRRSAHGRADSSCAASLNNVALSPKRPTKCVPIGRPSSFQNSGTDIAGCPVTLQIGVNGTNCAASAIPASGCSAGESKLPIGTGGLPSVGVSHTS